MNKIIVGLAMFCLLAAGAGPVQAAIAKPGASCVVAGKTAQYQSLSLKCAKVGIKLVWKPITASNAAVAPKEAPTPAPPEQALAAPATSTEEAWANSKFVKPTSANDTAKAATAAFEDYVSSTRWPNDKVAIWVEPGASSTLTTWISNGASLVAATFEKPASIPTFNDVVAVNRDYLVDTFTKLYDSAFASSQAGAWDSGNPAWGGRTSNAWSMSNISRYNGMVNDRVGMAQTAGHEYFHAIQENFTNVSGTSCGPCGTPQWFWEGPAMFVGVETAAHLGYLTYAEARQTSVNRVQGQPTAKLLLSQATINSVPAVDPYGIGELATEFLVANVGMKKFVDVYRLKGKGLKFEVAFQIATGVPLSDFYLMFEDSRTTLGIPIAK